MTISAEIKRRVYFAAAIAGIVVMLVAMFVASGQADAAQQRAAAVTQGLNCTKTDKANGGFVLDCDPGSVTPSPSPSSSASASPSSTPTASPSVSPSSSTSGPTPSATTSPSSSPTGSQLNCQVDPERCGFPNASTTGPTSGLTATTRTSYAVAGETVSGVAITGCVEVHAPGVTFRNVSFNVQGCFWGVRNFSTGLSVVDSAITCGGTNGTAFGSSDLSLLRVEISRCENGLNVAGRVGVIDSWIHDMNGGNGGAHTDGAQFNQGASDITFRHNTINVGPQNGATSAIIAWNEGNPQNARVMIENNLLAGGTYTLYCPRQNSTDFRVRNNRFGTYEYGSTDSCISGHVAEFSGNVRDSTGLLL